MIRSTILLEGMVTKDLHDAVYVLDVSGRPEIF